MASRVATISAEEANAQFGNLLRRARSGETVIITSRGTALAKLVPALDQASVEAAAEAEAERLARVDALFQRLRTQPPIHVEPWTRDELYEREPWPDGPPNDL